MEKQKNNIITIDSKNIYTVQRYVNAMKELNRFVKDNMSKCHREQLSIAPIIPDMHKEISALEKDLNRFLDCCVNDFIKKDMYFYYNDTANIHDNKYIHVISNVSGNRFRYEYVTIITYDNLNGVRAEASKRIMDTKSLPDEMTAKQFVWRIMDATAVEISKEKFEEMKQKYIAISKLAKNGTEN